MPTRGDHATSAHDRVHPVTEALGAPVGVALGAVATCAAVLAADPTTPGG